MATPFIGEIRMFGGNFAPKGWMLCNGQLLPIAQNQALFSLLGTTYGGDGRTTFALPNLMGRVPIHTGQGPGLTNRPLGEMAGQAAVTLTPAHLPAHSHVLTGSMSAANSNSAADAVPAQAAVNVYVRNPPPQGLLPLKDGTVGASSQSPNQPHPNLMPYVCITFMIALKGIYPSRN